MLPSQHLVCEAYRASIRHALGPSQIVEHEDGLLMVDSEGRISACDAFEKLGSRLPENCKVHDLRGTWIIPGFVDCHVHLPQLDCRNKNGLTLLDWLKKYIYPAEAQFQNSKVAFTLAKRFYQELLAHGITTAAIYCTVHFEATNIAFQIAKEIGIRGIIGQVLMDQNAPADLLKPISQLLNESEELISKWHGADKRLFYAITPRFALTCSKTLLTEAGKMARQVGCYFQTHLAETREEVAKAKEIFHFKNYPSFYEAMNCLSNHSIFAHAIYLNDDEWKILSGYDCSIAHCPTSNVFLKSGTMPVDCVEKYDIRYGFGTDVGAGPTFSMRELADCACEVHSPRLMNSIKAFYLATLGGAEALSMSDQLGNFIEGKWGDFSVFGAADFSGKAKAVFVAGKRIFGDVQL